MAKKLTMAEWLAQNPGVDPNMYAQYLQQYWLNSHNPTPQQRIFHQEGFDRFNQRKPFQGMADYLPGNINNPTIEDETDPFVALDEILSHPYTLPAVVGGGTFALFYYLGMNKDVLKETIRALGSIVPDSLHAEADIL